MTLSGPLPRALYGLILAGVAVGYYYYFGPGPTANELGQGPLEWWRPAGGALRWIPTLPLAALAGGSGPSALLPIGLFLAPLVALLAAGPRLFESAALRTGVLGICGTLALMVIYGYRYDRLWHFLSWRFTLVALCLCALVAALILAPSLLRSVLRLPRLAAGALLLGAFAGIFLLVTESTGTDPSRAWNVGPWPVLSVVGLLIAGYAFAGLHLAAGVGTWLWQRIGGRLGAAAGSIAAVAIGVAAAALVRGALATSALLALTSAVYLVALRRRTEPAALLGEGRLRAAAGAFLLVSIGVSSAASVRFQSEARDSTSQRVVDALEVYREQHQVYPDVLRELVPEQLSAVPRPRIGLLRGAGDVFTYSGFGDSYLLEFSSVQWVQCGYSPPYTDADDPNAAGLAVGARDNALEGSWSCAEQPPPLWGPP